MNRRELFKAGAGLLATFVLPAPRRHIDLRQFCESPLRRRIYRYDLALPYTHRNWVYATDARVCVRVRPAAADAADHDGKMPPFDSLSWNHQDLRGWRPLPERPAPARAAGDPGGRRRLPGLRRHRQHGRRAEPRMRVQRVRLA